MSQYNADVNGVECSIEIRGGDKNDHDAAEALIDQLDGTGLSVTEIAQRVEIQISEGWHDPNGFTVSIYPEHLIEKENGR